MTLDGPKVVNHPPPTSPSITISPPAPNEEIQGSFGESSKVISLPGSTEEVLPMVTDESNSASGTKPKKMGLTFVLCRFLEKSLLR